MKPNKRIFIIIPVLILSLMSMAGCSNSQSSNRENIYLCNSDLDCVPKPECHPLECINQKYADSSDKPKACTLIFMQEAAYSKEDCACQAGVCINKNRQGQAVSTEEESLALARDFVTASSTYLFDGSSIGHISTSPHNCQNCWKFTFSFASSHAGYGDRTGMMMAEVVTSHRAEVLVENGRVVEGIIDGTWDMIKDEPIAIPEE